MPSAFVKGENETENYVQGLTALLVSDGKRFHPKKWWSLSEFVNGVQSVDWMMGKAVGHKNKFDMDQKSREAELPWKRAA
jgi:hypothetical protein